jgi:hypothetical protein
MPQTRVIVLNSTEKDMGGDWTLCFQYCRYQFADHEQEGYRFIWKTPQGRLQPARGQARIPSIAVALELIAQAMHSGWGNKNGDRAGFEYDV